MFKDTHCCSPKISVDIWWVYENWKLKNFLTTSMYIISHCGTFVNPATSLCFVMNVWLVMLRKGAVLLRLLCGDVTIEKWLRP